VRDLAADFGPLAERLADFDRVAFACSFQKEESVLFDGLLPLVPGARVFTIDTGVLFPETLETWKRFEDHFGVHVEPFDAHGPWTGPEQCCGTAKVAALEAAIGDADAWVTGLRREQAATRAEVSVFDFDDRFGLFKANPLADWSDKDVWRYITERDLPYHPLHDQGYASIGCAPCTQPGAGREGRWAGTEKTECGLHA
jgi:phosphoadenosine phosphosulfate reductase